jgi:hypothetical protein
MDEGYPCFSLPASVKNNCCNGFSRTGSLKNILTSLQGVGVDGAPLQGYNGSMLRGAKDWRRYDKTISVYWFVV